MVMMKVGEEEFEDTKGVIRIHKSKKEKQQNGQKKKYNDLQNIHIKLKIEEHEEWFLLDIQLYSGSNDLLFCFSEKAQ